jgi:hypothetical protein
MDAFATYRVSSTTSNNRPCLKGVVEVESDKGWFAFTVFGFTAEEIQDSAYLQADRRAYEHGWFLQSLRKTK